MVEIRGMKVLTKYGMICFDDNEIKIITEVKATSPETIAKPFYNKSVRIEETGEKFVANLIWDERD